MNLFQNILEKSNQFGQNFSLQGVAKLGQKAEDKFKLSEKAFNYAQPEAQDPIQRYLDDPEKSNEGKQNLIDNLKAGIPKEVLQSYITENVYKPKEFSQMYGSTAPIFKRNKDDNPVVGALKAVGNFPSSGLNLLQGTLNIGRTAREQGIGETLDMMGRGIVRGIGEGAQAVQTSYNEGGVLGATNTILEGANKYITENPAEILAPSAIKPMGNLIKSGGKTIMQGAEVVAPKIVQPVKNLGQTIGQKYKGARQYLSGLDEKEISAIEKTSAKELDDIITQAKATQGKQGDYVQTPYHVGATKAQKTLNQLDADLKTRQSERLAVLDEAPIVQIDANDARMALKSALRSMNVEDIRIVDGKPEIIPVKGREALLDLSNPADVKALQKLNEILDGDVSPTQTMDRIKKLQEWAYENKSTIGVKGTSERMDGLIKRVQGSLNTTFKKQLPPEYAKILDSMSEDIKLSNEIKRVFGIDDNGVPVGNRGEMVMKRLVNGTTTGGEAREIAKQIFDRYGIDLVKEARLRQLAMDLVGDDRGQTLFGAITRGKSGLVDLAMQKTLGNIVNKEGVVRSLAKGKGEVIKKTEPIYTPNAFRKGMAEQARMPKALPAPSGKPISAQNVGVSPMTSSPKFDAMTGQKGIRPSTTKKPEPKPAPKLLQSGYVINKNGEKILLNPTKNAIIEESKKGLSPNVKRPNGTPLRNSKNNTSSSNTKGSKQTIVKPSPQVKPVEKTVKPKNLTEGKQSATMGDMETKKLIKPIQSYKGENGSIKDILKSKYSDKVETLDIYENESAIFLNRVKVKEQGKGIGTEILSEMKKYADRTGKRIELTPEKIANTSKEKLIQWYKKNGFVENKGKNKDFSTREAMYYSPKK